MSFVELKIILTSLNEEFKFSDRKGDDPAERTLVARWKSVKKFEERGYVHVGSLAYVINWIRMNDPDAFAYYKPRIVDSLREHDKESFLHHLYAMYLQSLDVSKLSVDQLKNIIDEDKSGTGNVVIDLFFNSMSFKQQRDFDPEVAEMIIDSIPQILEKCDRLRENHQSDSSLRDFQEFVKVPSLAIRIFIRAIAEEETQPNGMWKSIVDRFYTPKEQLEYRKNVQGYFDVEKNFLHIIDTKPDEYSLQNKPPEKSVEALRNILILAREIYNNNYGGDAHFHYVIALITSGMLESHTYAFAVDPGKDPSATIRHKLMLTDKQEEADEFDAFLRTVRVRDPEETSGAKRRP